jgi:mono/diheme cytochrome c family protein
VSKPRFDGKDMADLLAFVRRNARRPLASGKLLFPGNPTVGRQLFASKGCNECHSIRGRGGKVGPDLAASGDGRSVTDTAGDLWNHGLEMWTRMRGAGIERPVFAGNEMADLVAYLYFARAVGQPGDRLAGKKLFVQKGCASCHSGNGIGPDLRASKALNSPMSLITAMWNHAGMMESAVKERSLPWPKFEGDEMADLMDYLRSEGKLAGMNK